jgi:hypothetical protein
MRILERYAVMLVLRAFTFLRRWHQSISSERETPRRQGGGIFRLGSSSLGFYLSCQK